MAKREADIYLRVSGTVQYSNDTEVAKIIIGKSIFSLFWCLKNVPNSILAQFRPQCILPSQPQDWLLHMWIVASISLMILWLRDNTWNKCFYHLKRIICFWTPCLNQVFPFSFRVKIYFALDLQFDSIVNRSLYELSCIFLDRLRWSNGPIFPILLFVSLSHLLS